MLRPLAFGSTFELEGEPHAYGAEVSDRRCDLSRAGRSDLGRLFAVTGRRALSIPIIS